MEKSFVKMLTFSVFALLLITLLQSACKTAPDAVLPKDILGVSIGMSKTDAEEHLRKIAKFAREEQKRQQLWQLIETSRFSSLAIGFDAEDKVSFVAAITNDEGGNKLRYSDVGDLSKAQQDVSEGNYRYVWDVAANGESPAYQVISHGNKPDYPMVLTLNKTGGKGADEDEEEERKEREGK